MKTVYLSFATDIIHNGHINIIKKAAESGEVIAGVQTDENCHEDSKISDFTLRRTVGNYQ